MPLLDPSCWILGLLAALPGNPPDATRVGTLTGIVHDPTSRLPVPNALVLLRRTDGFLPAAPLASAQVPGPAARRPVLVDVGAGATPPIRVVAVGEPLDLAPPVGRTDTGAWPVRVTSVPFVPC